MHTLSFGHVHSIYHDPCISALSYILPLFLIHYKIAIISYFSCLYPRLNLFFFLKFMDNSWTTFFLHNTITLNKINTLQMPSSILSHKCQHSTPHTHTHTQCQSHTQLIASQFPPPPCFRSGHSSPPQSQPTAGGLYKSEMRISQALHHWNYRFPICLK